MTDDRARDIIDRLHALRRDDAPTHGGRVLSYVYDAGIAGLDELARAAAASVQSVNGLDPTTFPSVARLERDVIDTARVLVHGDRLPTVGLITSGGTESCLLAVKSARDRWRGAGGVGRPRIVAPTSVHAAFHKAAGYFDVDLDLVPVDREGRVDADEFIERLDATMALVVVSAPNYPYGTLDPVEQIAAAADDLRIRCHVDACIGGWVLPFWDEASGGDTSTPAWDFRLPGVTSISLDSHKYGFAPKGTSVLLFRHRDDKRAAGFATTSWPGYPVVNPTMLGSRSATSLAAAWAVISYLGTTGFVDLTRRTHRATTALLAAVGGIDGLRVVGDPVGPLFSVATDPSVPVERRVDPHIWSDRVRTTGWVLQPQPGATQFPSGPELPRTTHLTITPVTDAGLADLVAALTSAADAVRGTPPIDATDLAAAFPRLAGTGPVSADDAHEILTELGLGGDDSGALPDALAPVMALLDVIPPGLARSLLAELIARLNES
ncbi:pyridoxal phosphate-dependent decarboxylase family protein [Gordonia soli]|uniref:Putative lyase n=1 Tax=Gordonia soli NBRC 108243 TaxID=1223545 RepID=M0QEB7_9ACTN|nr:aspartate aminotransferase family protein [Gordonia soli]GAC66789.1 putative lyase [Gordonia soli NBRC 108243]